MTSSQKEIAVIGDIHGCINTLEKLYEKISGMKYIYSVGDLVDRGRYSRQVIDFAIANNIRTVRGNHEDMMLKAVEASGKVLSFMNEDAELYYYNGGKETQYSYVESRSYSDIKNFYKKLKSTKHIEYVKSMPLKFEFKQAVITHAGITEGGNDMTMMWNRKEPAFIGKLQIHGHTPLREFKYKPNHYLNIDTGCVFNNKLTAAVIDTQEGKVLEIIQENCSPLDIYD